MKLRKQIILGLAAVFAAAGIGVYAVKDVRKYNSSTSDGLRVAPEIEVQSVEGKTLTLDQWKDHVVVVHFWASWCGPCIPEIPEILGAAKKLPKDQSGRPVYWLLVSQDTSWEKARTVVKHEGLPENVILALDPEAKASDQFGSYQFPETYLIARNRGIGAKWIGPQGWSGAWGEQALAGIESLSRLERLPTGAQQE